MPIKDPAKRKEYHKRYHKEWYAKNKEKRLRQKKERDHKIRQWFKNYKKTLKCGYCPENHPACLEFHHEKDDKLADVSWLVHRGYSITRIMEEVEKCEVMCANCHRKFHNVD